MTDLKAIRVFLTVVEHLSFSSAARALQMTPASVTRIVAKLEETLGQQLLLRTTRQVSLTSAGAVVAARYKPIVDDFDRVTGAITQANRPDYGRLRINAPVSMGVRLMPQLVDAFGLAYPNIGLNVRLDDRLVDIIEEDCDLAIRISRAPTDKSTIWRKICEVPLYPVAAPSLFERTREPTKPDEIDADFAMSYSADGKAETWEFIQGSIKRSVRAGTHILSNNGDFLYAMARAGAGICVLPEFLVKRGIERGEVKRVLPAWDLPSLWLTLFYPPYEQLPPLVATFTDFFEAYIRDLDGLVFEDN